MAVNLRKKYYGKESVSKKNRPYRFQLDYSLQGKRVRETIKDIEFLTSDTKEIRNQKERIVNKIKADLEILSKAEKLDLNDLKVQSGLSNKKWDKVIKDLTQNKIAKIEKTYDGLFVEFVG